MALDDSVTCFIKDCNVAFPVDQVLKRTTGSHIWTFLTPRGMFEVCVVLCAELTYIIKTFDVRLKLKRIQSEID